MCLDVAKHGGLDAAEGKINALGARGTFAAVGMLDLRGRKLHRVGVAVWRELVDDGSAGVAVAEQLGDLVVCLAGGIVTRFADVFVVPTGCVLFAQIKMGVSAGDNQREHGKL